MILAEQTKRRRGCLRQRVAYKTKEMGALARLPFHQLYSFFSVPDSYYIRSLPCQILITLCLFRARFLLFSGG